MNDWQTVFNLLGATVLSMAGWFLKGLRDDLTTTQRDQAEFRTEVAEKYTPKDDFRRMEDKLDRILERLPPK